MKKTTSLYLNELYANRVNRHLERALDGRGSLTGFFAWVAEQAHAALIEEGNKVRYSQKGCTHSELRWLRVLTKASPNMNEYQEAWESYTKYFPWHPTNPAASHVLALFTLMQESPLWNRPRGVFQRNAQESSLADSGEGPLEAFIEAATRNKELDSPLETNERTFFLLWYKDRLEILGEPPRSQPISVYVYPEAHRALLRTFRNTLFDRLLGTLDDLLAHAWFWPQYLLAFLERPEAFDAGATLEAELEEYALNSTSLRLEPGGVVSLGGHHLLTLTRTPEDITWLLEHLKHRILSKPRPDKAGHDQAEYLSWCWFILDWQALNDVIIRFGAAPVRRILESFLPEEELCEVNPLVWVALDLGVLGRPIQSRENLRAQLVGTFMTRYGLRELGPERRLAYQVLRQILPQEERVQDPLEFHVLRLLQAYALEVLPEEEREPERVSHAMLCTLGQPDLFPVRDTLEAWTGLHVRADGPERWRFYQGRKLWKTLSSQEAASVAYWLNQLAPVSHDYTAKEVGAIKWGLKLKASNVDNPSLLETDELRVVYALGPEVLEAVLELVAAYPGNQKANWMRGTFQPLMTALIGRLRQRASVKARRVHV